MQAIDLTSYLLGIATALIPVIVVWLKDEWHFRREKTEKQKTVVRGKIEGEVLPLLDKSYTVVKLYKITLEDSQNAIEFQSHSKDSFEGLESVWKTVLDKMSAVKIRIYLPKILVQETDILFTSIAKISEIMLQLGIQTKDWLKKKKTALDIIQHTLIAFDELIAELCKLLGTDPYPLELKE